jgi:hypothetical protein
MGLSRFLQLRMVSLRGYVDRTVACRPIAAISTGNRSPRNSYNILTNPPLCTAGDRPIFSYFSVRTGSRERLPLGLRPRDENAVRADRIVNPVSIEPADCCCLMAEIFDINACQRFDLIYCVVANECLGSVVWDV